MTENDLRTLLRSTHSTFAEVMKDHPELADKLLALSLSDAGKRLARTVRDVPDDVRAKVETIDFSAVHGDVAEHLRSGGASRYMQVQCALDEEA